MPTWLWRSIVATSMTIVVVVASSQWVACRFVVLPQIWPWYARYVGTEQGSKIDPSPMGCNDADARSIAVLMGVRTTLISLSRKAE